MPYNFLTVNARFVQRAPFPFSLPPPSRLPLKAVLPSCRRSLSTMPKQPFYEVKAAFSVIQKAALSHTEAAFCHAKVAFSIIQKSALSHTEVAPPSCKSSLLSFRRSPLVMQKQSSVIPKQSLSHAKAVFSIIPKQSLRLYRNIPLTPNHSLANGHGVPRLLPHVLCIQP